MQHSNLEGGKGFDNGFERIPNTLSKRNPAWWTPLQIDWNKDIEKHKNIGADRVKLLLCRRASKLHYELMLDPTGIVCNRMLFYKFQPDQFFQGEREKNMNYKTRRFMLGLLVLCTALLPLVYVRVNDDQCGRLPHEQDAPWVEDFARRTPGVSTVLDFIFSTSAVSSTFAHDASELADEHRNQLKAMGNARTAGWMSPPQRSSAAANFVADMARNQTQQAARGIISNMSDYIVGAEGHSENQCKIFELFSAHKVWTFVILFFGPMGMTMLLGLITHATNYAHGDHQQDSVYLLIRRGIFFPLLQLWWRYLDAKVPTIKYANDQSGVDHIVPWFYSPPSVYVAVSFVMTWGVLLLAGYMTNTIQTSVIVAFACGEIFTQAANVLLASTPGMMLETQRRINSWRPKFGVRADRPTVLEKIAAASEQRLTEISLSANDLKQLKQLPRWEEFNPKEIDERSHAVGSCCSPVSMSNTAERVGGDASRDAVALIKYVVLIDEARRVDLVTGEFVKSGHLQGLGDGAETDDHC